MLLVGAGEACNLLIFRSRFNCLGKDRRLRQLLPGQARLQIQMNTASRPPKNAHFWR